jgi:hypothetical protein
VTEVVRPWWGRLLVVGIAVICASMVVFAGLQGGADDALLVLPWTALVAGACWATFWRPRVEVSDAGVRIVNVTRTIHIPWPALHAIETKWALTLVTAYGRYTAWSAPAPGARGALRSLADRRDDPSVVDPAGTVRPGDLSDSPSGSAAAVVRDRWTQLRAAGHLDDPRLEHDRAQVTWHLGTLAIGVALLAVGIVTAI